MRHGRSNSKWLLLCAITIAVLCFCAWLLITKKSVASQASLKRVIIGAPSQISVGALYVGRDQHLFARHGIDIKVEPFALGRQALQAVIAGECDLAVVADTPFMFAVMDGKQIAALTTLFGSRRTMAVVGRKDRGVHKAEDLAGKKIGTFFGTNAQFFLDTLLVAHSVDRSSVSIVNIAPGKISDALKNGDLDAVTVWDPDLSKLQQSLGDQAATIYDEGIFVYRFILVGKRDYIDQHPEEMRQVLAAFADATSYIHREPAKAQVVIEQALGSPPHLLNNTFNPNDFYLTLDQTLLLSLSAETRWAMKQGLVKPGPVPNYLDYIRQQPLESVLPNAIKFIR